MGLLATDFADVDLDMNIYYFRALTFNMDLFSKIAGSTVDTRIMDTGEH
jgi:hypothetical protein